MKKPCLSVAILAVALISGSAFAQSTIVINTPGEQPAKPVLSAAEKRLFDRNILPKVRKKLVDDVCKEEVEIAAIMHGAFSRMGADQTLIFYQFCQTGNGLGSAGLALFENGKVAGSYVSAEAGWTVDAKVLPDINKNGLTEVALYYSGGMHQGAGGTGVDIMEFSNRGVRGIGWFQAESFTEKTNAAYKISVKTGAVPTFFREKWTANSAGKYRKIGKIVPFKLEAAIGKFETVN